MPQQRQDDRSINRYFDLIRDLPLLTVEEERTNGRLWQRHRKPEGLQRLVEGNLRYVVKEARKFRGMGLDLVDLISEGNLGLIEAAKRYDPERDNKFLTYANWWVRQSIFHALAECGNRIRLPQKVAGQLRKIRRLATQIEQNLGREPIVQDLVEASQLPVEEVEWIQRLQQSMTPVSTDLVVGESDLTLGELIEQTTQPSPLDTLEQESFLNQLQRTLDMLQEKERQILTLHYGLGGGDPLTLETIGQSLKPPISRERVRQLEERAFSKIRGFRENLLGQFLQGGFSWAS
jgi:RNA polymerase primary sigma factor